MLVACAFSPVCLTKIYHAKMQQPLIDGAKLSQQRLIPCCQGKCCVKQCIQFGEFLLLFGRSVQQTSPCTLERIYLSLFWCASLRQVFHNKQLQSQSNLIELLNLAKVVLLNRIAPIGHFFDEPIRCKCPEGFPNRTAATPNFWQSSASVSRCSGGYCQ